MHILFVVFSVIVRVFCVFSVYQTRHKQHRSVLLRCMLFCHSPNCVFRSKQMLGLKTLLITLWTLGRTQLSKYVAQWVARLTRDRWIPVSREFEPHQSLVS